MASDKAFWQWIERASGGKGAAQGRPPHPAEGRRPAPAPSWRPGTARIRADARAQQDAPNLEGVTLRVFTQTGPFISGPVKFHAPEFQEQYGAVVEAIEAPNADLFARAQQVAQTGSGDFDILLLANTWMPDFVNLEYVVPLAAVHRRRSRGRAAGLGRHPRRHQAQELLGRADLHLHRRQRQPDDVLPQGHPRATRSGRRRSTTATGKDLPNPPQTLTGVRRGRQVLRPERRRRGVERRRHRATASSPASCAAQQSYWYSYPWTAPYSVAADRRGAGRHPGHLHLRPRHEPADQHRRLRARADRVRRRDPGRDEAGPRRRPRDRHRGHHQRHDADVARLGRHRTRLGRRALRGQEQARLCPDPGRHRVLRLAEQAPGSRCPRARSTRRPTHAYNGWSYYITSQTPNPEAAWEWIKLHASPGISAFDVASPDSGYQPWRNSHATNLEPWIGAGWDEAEAKAYIDTILAATDHPNAVFDPRLPGAARYQETLELLHQPGHRRRADAAGGDGPVRHRFQRHHR